MNKKAFSLIEIIVASSILSIAVFWVYKMIWENNKIINNSNNYLNKTLLFPIIEICIEKSWINSGINYIDLGVNLKWCSINSSEVINSIDNVDYIFIAQINTDLLKSRVWDIIIKDEFSWTSTGMYMQKK